MLASATLYALSTDGVAPPYSDCESIVSWDGAISIYRTNELRDVLTSK